jgi:hypothetical protein
VLDGFFYPFLHDPVNLNLGGFFKLWGFSYFYQFTGDAKALNRQVGEILQRQKKAESINFDRIEVLGQQACGIHGFPGLAGKVGS